MSSLLTTSFIQDEIKDIFGYDEMCFEGTDEMISRSVARCLRTLNEYKPKISRYSLEDVSTSEDDVVYIDFGVGVMGIRNVDFTGCTTSSLEEDPFALYYSSMNGGAGLTGSQFDLDWYIIRRDRTEITKKLFGTMEDWMWVEEEKRLVLYVPNGPKNVYIEYFEIFTLPTQILIEDDQLFLDMVTAQMKIRIGMMRRKYGGALPTAGNISIQLDGDQLVQEGREDWEKLLEKLSLIKHEIGINYE